MRWGIPILLILLVLTACQTQTPQKGPTIGDLESTVPDASVEDLPKLPRPVLLASVLVTKYDFPLESDLEKPWKLISTKELSKARVAAWKANGIRVGILNPRQYNEFHRGLPNSEGRRLQRFAGTELYEPVELIRGRAGVSSSGMIKFYSLNEPPQEMQMKRGRWQFLVRCERHGPNVYLELMPHHHSRKISLHPRTQHEIDLDGTKFTQLALRTLLQPSQYLVVVVAPPKPKSKAVNGAQAPEPIGNVRLANPNVLGAPPAAANQAAPNPNGQVQQANQKPPLFNRDSIGGHLLVANSMRGPRSKVKMLLIISINPINAPLARPNRR